MDLEKVNLPIHYHFVSPVKSGWKGDCCGVKFEAISDGYYCRHYPSLFFHKTCSNPPQKINHPSHKCSKTLFLEKNRFYNDERCGLCGEKLLDYIMYYTCPSCDLKLHLDCARYPPREIIDVPQNHDHNKLKLEMVRSCFTCAACGEDGDGYSYKCHECDLRFHVSCQKYEVEVNHPSHSLHPLKLYYGEPPAYTDGKCRLCGEKLVNYEVYYHCSTCNFSLDMGCVRDPPPLYHHDLNTHDHKLTLMPKSISFTCTVCGLNGDRSPYVCLQCDFVAHNDCSGFPWVININRHKHGVSRTSLVGVVNSVCGVCQKKMDWSCGGYSCKRCPSSVFHTKCATRDDVWDGIEMKDEPEEDEDIEPFKVIDENTIQHFLNRNHHLRLDKSGIFIEERNCKACAHPIYHHSFYSCMECNFMLHESCANLPTQKRHVLSTKPYLLRMDQDACSECKACGGLFNGFKYGYYNGLDVRCASVSEPFVHKSHPQHPLFYTSPRGSCSACNNHAYYVLRCVEEDCGYVLDFKCALLPYEVKHRIDYHLLSLCYGEKDASGQYWCDICEEGTDPKTWFYTCKDCGVTLHTNCVLGEFRGLGPESHLKTPFFWGAPYEVVRNNSMSRPLCSKCKSRCIFPIILKRKSYNDILAKYFCSISCCPYIPPGFT